MGSMGVESVNLFTFSENVNSTGVRSYVGLAFVLDLYLKALVNCIEDHEDQCSVPSWHIAVGVLESSVTHHFEFNHSSD